MWSPLARGGSLLAEPLITGLAAKYGRTPAQVVLRWHIQLGNLVIPKSVHAERIAENIDMFGLSLSDDELAAITALGRGQRLGPDPDTFG